MPPTLRERIALFLPGEEIDVGEIIARNIERKQAKRHRRKALSCRCVLWVASDEPRGDEPQNDCSDCEEVATLIHSKFPTGVSCTILDFIKTHDKHHWGPDFSSGYFTWSTNPFLDINVCEDEPEIHGPECHGGGCLVDDLDSPISADIWRYFLSREADFEEKIPEYDEYSQDWFHFLMDSVKCYNSDLGIYIPNLELHCKDPFLELHNPEYFEEPFDFDEVEDRMSWTFTSNAGAEIRFPRAFR